MRHRICEKAYRANAHEFVDVADNSVLSRNLSGSTEETFPAGAVTVVGILARDVLDRRKASVRTGLTLLVSIVLAGGALLTGCSLVPQKPDAVFLVYRDRMKAGNIQQARELLTDESRKLAVDLETAFKLRQPPENLSLLNVLDPVSPAVMMKEGDGYALLQARTLKGGLRLIRLTRADDKSPWKIDMVEELDALRVFLEARGALDMIREQAGEYAAFWKAFTDQLGRMRAPEEPRRDLKEKKPPDKQKKKEPPKKKPASKPGTE